MCITHTLLFSVRQCVSLLDLFVFALLIFLRYILCVPQQSLQTAVAFDESVRT